MVASLPVVSVVMPSYNCHPYIAAAIDSVLTQTFEYFELIIVDNFSSDGTFEIAKSYSDSRIRIEQYQNQGIIAKSRNLGIQKSRSEIIAFLDADDFWFPTKLADCVPMIDNEMDFVYHSEYWFDEQNNFKEVEYGSGNHSTYRNLLYKGNVVSTSSVVVKKSALSKVGGFCEKECYKTAEDYDLWLRLSKNGAKFIYLKRLLGAYRIHSNNSIKQEKVHESAMISVLSDHIGADKKGIRQLLRARRRMSLLFAESGFAKARNGEIKNSLQKFLIALKHYPLGLQSLALLVSSIPFYCRISKKKL